MEVLLLYVICVLFTYHSMDSFPNFIFGLCYSKSLFIVTSATISLLYLYQI
jgi:hypothetical protein